MTRTTICLHESILKQAKKIAHERHRTLGQTITDLLTIGIQHQARSESQNRKPFSLPTFSMGSPIVPLEDKEALMTVLEKKPI